MVDDFGLPQETAQETALAMATGEIKTFPVPKNIRETINLVMREVGGIGKKASPGVQYQFRKVDDVYNALYPAFAENGLFVLPSVDDFHHEVIRSTSSQGKEQLIYRAVAKVTYTLIAEDGSFVKAQVVAEATDYSDKGMGKMMSYAFKQMAFQVFCIPVDPNINHNERLDSEQDDIRIPADAVVANRNVPLKVPIQTPAERVAALPKMSDVPKTSMPAVDKVSSPEQSVVAITVDEQGRRWLGTTELMTNSAWQGVRNKYQEVYPTATELERSNWYVTQLREWGVGIPAIMDNLPREHGVKLYKYLVAELAKERPNVE